MNKKDKCLIKILYWLFGIRIIAHDRWSSTRYSIETHTSERRCITCGQRQRKTHLKWENLT